MAKSVRSLVTSRSSAVELAFLGILNRFGNSKQMGEPFLQAKGKHVPTQESHMPRQTFVDDVRFVNAVEFGPLRVALQAKEKGIWGTFRWCNQSLPSRRQRGKSWTTNRLGWAMLRRFTSISQNSCLDTRPGWNSKKLYSPFSGWKSSERLRKAGGLKAVQRARVVCFPELWQVQEYGPSDLLMRDSE